MYTSILERAWGGIEKSTSHVTVVCAHHDVPAFAETSITPYPNFLTERFSFNCGNHLRSDLQVHTTCYYRRIDHRREGIGEERNQSCRHVMCVAGFAATHDRRTLICDLKHGKSIVDQLGHHGDKYIIHPPHRASVRARRRVILGEGSMSLSRRRIRWKCWIYRV